MTANPENPGSRLMRTSVAPSDQPSVSIVVLAYNEERNLPLAVAGIRHTLAGRKLKYEIIIVNDGSKDKTQDVAEGLASLSPEIRSVNNPGNQGCGYTYWHGAREARYDYVWLIPGDGEITNEALSSIADRIGKADILLPYVTNFRIRPFSRRLVSWGYTVLLNTLFLKNIHYYNGPFVVRRNLLESVVPVPSRDFTFQAPIILPLVKRGCSYEQIGIMLQPRHYGNPTFGSSKAISRAFKIVSRLWWQTYILRRKEKADTEPGQAGGD
jgi:dolichol-phosphate mannosyltransferase